MTESQPQQSWLTRRNLLKIGAAGAVGLGLSEYLRSGSPAARANPGAQVVFWESPYSSTPVPEGVLFGFDPNAFPEESRENVLVELHEAVRYTDAEGENIVVPPGEPGSWDESTEWVEVRKVDDVSDPNPYKLWYYGASSVGAIGLAESPDGLTWQKPNLGLVEFDGNSDNNMTTLNPDTGGATQLLAVLYDPGTASPFKAVYIDFFSEEQRIAYSIDGKDWTQSLGNPQTDLFNVNVRGTIRFNGTYYVNGHWVTSNPPLRTLVTFSSSDFETWSDTGVIGLDRSPLGLCPPEAEVECTEQVHQGAAMFNRNNVVIGIYDRWQVPVAGPGSSCPPPFGDHQGCDVDNDLGLALSYDAISWIEPVPGFKVQTGDAQEAHLPPAEQHPNPTITKGSILNSAEAERTLLFFGGFHLAKSGARLATWELDRMGELKPDGGIGAASATSTLVEIQSGSGPASLYVNATGLAAGTAELRINLIDDNGQPIMTHQDAVVSTSGFAELVQWGSESALPIGTSFRLQVYFEGANLEDINLHAVYVRE